MRLKYFIQFRSLGGPQGRGGEGAGLHKITLFRYLIFVFLNCSMRVRKFFVWIPDKKRETFHFSVTETSFCHSNHICHIHYLLSHNIISVTETSLCGRNFFLWQKLLSVTETSFCDRNFFLRQKLLSVTETYFCHWNYFLSQKIMWQKLVYDAGTFFCDKYLFLTKYIFVWLFTREFLWKVSVRNGSFRYLG